MIRVMTMAAVMAAAGAAHAATYSFERISSNAGQDVSEQFSVEMIDVGGGAVDLIFRNSAEIKSSISLVYIDNGPGGDTFDTGTLQSQVGASFVFGTGSPANLPGGFGLSETFSTTPGFLADAKGNPSNGLSTASDHLVLRFVLNGGLGFADALAAVEDGTLRFGLHVRSIGDGGNSDSFVNVPRNVPIIPLPSAAGLGLLGLALTATRRRR
ncbi:MAG: hypothetical protein EA378_09215 [Phycisphaerales bacterium]|nr:MAG: hypothetical protein EA378_09215 [Phycisphaerales bacterium]